MYIWLRLENDWWSWVLNGTCRRFLCTFTGNSLWKGKSFLNPRILKQLVGRWRRTAREPRLGQGEGRTTVDTFWECILISSSWKVKPWNCEVRRPVQGGTSEHHKDPHCRNKTPTHRSDFPFNTFVVPWGNDKRAEFSIEADAHSGFVSSQRVFETNIKTLQFTAQRSEQRSFCFLNNNLSGKWTSRVKMKMNIKENSSFRTK